MLDAGGLPIPGVRALDHTADLGLEIRAPDLPELFRRAALGAMWLVLERPLGEVRESDEARTVALAEVGLDALLRSWLRTVLFWDEVEGFSAVDAKLVLLPTPHCDGPEGQAFGLQGRVIGRLDPGPRVREIKGVTFHGLRVETEGGQWFGRVIFDV